MHLLGPAGKILLTITLSFFGIAFLFSLYSPPVYGQTANAWNIQRITTSNLLDFYYSTGGSTILELNPNGQSGIRSIVDLDNPTTYFLDPNGTSNVFKLGIGTTAPTAKLSISSGADVGAGTLTSVLKISKGTGAYTGTMASGDGPGIDFSDYYQDYYPLRIGARSEGITSNYPNYAFVVNTNVNGVENEKFRISSAGNVGIGTTAPAALLHIIPGAKEGLRLSSGAGRGSSLMSYGSGSGDGLYAGANVYYDGSAWQRMETGASGWLMQYGPGTGDIFDIGRSVSGVNPVSAFTSLLRIDSNGNVGIGTTAPTQKLDIAGNVNISGTVIGAENALYLRQIGSNPSYTGTRFYLGNGTPSGYVYGDTSGFGLLYNGGGWAIRIPPNASGFYSSYMYDSDNGGYLIDPASTSTLNTVNGGVFSGSQFNATGQVQTSEWFRVNGAQGIYWNSYGGGWYMQDGTYLRSYNTKPVLAPYYSDQDNAGYYADPASTSNLNQVNAVRYYSSVYSSWLPATNNWNYLRGPTYAFDNAWYDENNPAYYIDPASNSQFNNVYANNYYLPWLGWLSSNLNQNVGVDSGPNFGNISMNNAWFEPYGMYINTWVDTNYSDSRLKKNIQTMTDDTAGKIDQLQPVSFEWIEKSPETGFDQPKGTKYGLIAQEVEKIFPDMVETDGKGYKSINFNQVTSLLVKSFQDLKQKNLDLEEQNTKLKNRLDSIEAEINQLKEIKH